MNVKKQLLLYVQKPHGELPQGFFMQLFNGHEISFPTNFVRSRIYHV